VERFSEEELPEPEEPVLPLVEDEPDPLEDDWAMSAGVVARQITERRAASFLREGCRFIAANLAHVPASRNRRETVQAGREPVPS
jgi:hypothetical protein